MDQDLVTSLRNDHAAPVALEQEDAKLLLHEPDLPAKCWLGDVEAIGSLAYTPELGDMNQGL
jgi:hypothetical protein